MTITYIAATAAIDHTEAIIPKLRNMPPSIGLRKMVL